MGLSEHLDSWIEELSTADEFKGGVYECIDMVISEIKLLKDSIYELPTENNEEVKIEVIDNKYIFTDEDGESYILDEVPVLLMY